MVTVNSESQNVQLTPVQRCMAGYKEKPVIQPSFFKSFLKAVVPAVGSGDGPYKTTSGGKVLSEWGIRAAPHLQPYFKANVKNFFKGGSTLFGQGASALITTKVPATLKDLVDAVSVVQDGDLSSKATWNLTRKTLEGFVDVSIIASMLSKSSTALRSCTIISFVCDLMDFKEEVDGLAKATEGVKKPYVDYTKPNPIEQGRYALLRIAKLTASITAGIIALLGIVLQAHLVDPIILLTLSSANIALSLIAKIYQGMMTHEIVARQIKADHQNLAIA